MGANELTPPELETIKIEIEGEIGTMTLDRPETFNAMSPDLIQDLATAFAWFADQAPLRGLIVTGSGKAFCAGGDLNWFKAGQADPDVDIVASVRRGAEMLHSGIVDLQRIPYPVIAALNGPRSAAPRSAAALNSRSPATSGSARRTPSSPARTAASASPRTAG